MIKNVFKYLPIARNGFTILGKSYFVLKLINPKRSKKNKSIIKAYKKHEWFETILCLKKVVIVNVIIYFKIGRFILKRYY